MRIIVGQSRNCREFLDDTEQYNTTVVLYTDSKIPKSGEQQAITAMWRNVLAGAPESLRPRRGHLVATQALQGGQSTCTEHSERRQVSLVLT
jgi:hypothetical protein